MSMILMAQALKMKVGNPLRKLVLIKLADNANDEGLCWPSHSHIAEHCEMSKRSVINHINALSEANYLTIIPRVKDNKKQSNHYQIHFEKVEVSSESPALPKQISSESPARCSESPALPSSESPAHRTCHSSEPVIESITCEVSEIFEFWKITMGKKRSQLTNAVKSKIRARLADGFSLDELRAAITGCKTSDFHMGANPAGTIYNSLELIFKNSNKTEEFIEKNQNYSRRLAHESNYSNTSKKPASAVTAADVFAMRNSANDGQGFEADPATVREINPEVRNSIHQPVYGNGAHGAGKSGVGSSICGRPNQPAANEDGSGCSEKQGYGQQQAQPISAEPSRVSGPVSVESAVGKFEFT